MIRSGILDSLLEYSQMATEVKVQLVEGTLGVAIARQHAIVVDRNANLGGTDLGFTGGEVFFSGIGTCLLTTLIGAARARDITLTKVEFSISGEQETSPSRWTAINVNAVVEGDASPEEIQKLVTIAERSCIVSNTVALGAPIHVSLNQTAGSPALAPAD
jgi:putative redox protein